jgi:pyruvate-ferredoxin/flavodoxin oxidoreductase
MLADYLVPKSVWIIGGDGWAYDIGYGGLDHVLSTKHNVNILVLDTGVYSNTGGRRQNQPLGPAVCAHGKVMNKKDLGLMAMSYGHVYVASVALGAQEGHTLKAFLEAGSYQGPSIIIAYSHCIAQGYDLRYGAQQQKLAVECGVWPLYRYDPRRAEAGEPPLVVDAEGGKRPVSEYMMNETRFKMVEKLDPEAFRRYAVASQLAAERRTAAYIGIFPSSASCIKGRRNSPARRTGSNRHQTGKGDMIMISLHIPWTNASQSFCRRSSRTDRPMH